MNLIKEREEFLKSEDGRKWFINKTYDDDLLKNSWQNYHTPYDLCEKMISKTNMNNKSILVLFNIEFLEVLIHKFGVLSKNITFLADCRLEAEIASKSYKVNCIIINKDNIWETLKKMKQFDLCFSNPPYTKGADLEILIQIIKICDEIVWVHPVNWILDKRPESNKKINVRGRELKKLISDILESIYVFYGNIIFNINIYYACGIIHINKNKKYKNIKINYFNKDIYEVEDINDISIFGPNWKNIIEPFKNKLEYECNKNYKSIFHYRKTKSQIRKYEHCCQFTSMQAVIDKTEFDKDILDIHMYGQDWHRIINPNQDYNIKTNPKTSGELFYCFQTQEELDNFIEYLKTDFVRFCIAIYKTNHTIFEGSECIVPYLGFKEKWTDEKLYKKFKIPQEIIDYISNFFSKDLYNLRNKS